MDAAREARTRARDNLLRAVERGSEVRSLADRARDYGSDLDNAYRRPDS